MNRKAFVRIVAIVLAVILLGSVVVAAVSSLTASAAVTQSEIDELKAQAETLQSEKDEIAEKVNSLEYERMTVLSQKAVLDEQVNLTQQEIDNTTKQIETYTRLVAEKADEVVAAQAEEDAQWERYKVRMRAMEENGPIAYLSVLFEADSFADFLAAIDFIGRMMEYDKQVYNELETARHNTEDAKVALEETKAAHEQAKEELVIKEQELEKQVEAAGELIAAQEASLDTFNKYITEIDTQQEELDAEIDKLIDEYEKQEAERKAAEEAAANRDNGSGGGDGYYGGSAVGSGSFIWPAPASNIVTSLYGTRLHPIYNTYRTHYGVDIGASYGTNVLASDGGVVMVAEYHWSFGNYIMINHGNGYVTLYGHMSALLVSAGQSVSQGDVIGLIGSTGDSTGPHLHFEVRADGNRIDPLQFFSGYIVSE